MLSITLHKTEFVLHINIYRVIHVTCVLSFLETVLLTDEATFSNHYLVH